MVAVSVIIPHYNRVEPLASAVRSVLEQRGVSLELLVVDDGSTCPLDNLRSYVEQHGGRWLSRPRGGVAAARNTGIEEARGEWIALLDSDDYWCAEKLSRQLQYHTEHSQYRLSQTDEIWYRHGHRVSKKAVQAPPAGDVFRECTERCCISPSSVLIHRSVFATSGLFDETLPACEDYEFWLRVARTYAVGYLPEQLAVKHGGGTDQLSRRFAAMDRFRVYALLQLVFSAALTPQQYADIESALRSRLAILAQGGKRRGTELAGIALSVTDLVDRHGLKYVEWIPAVLRQLQETWQAENQRFLQS